MMENSGRKSLRLLLGKRKVSKKGGIIEGKMGDGGGVLYAFLHQKTQKNLVRLLRVHSLRGMKEAS